MKPHVSIVFITYNQERYVKQALDSFLMQQTNFDFEVLVHDDASTDKTAQIIRQYARRHPGKFRLYLEKKNQYSLGNVSFVKHLYEQAKGKYIAVCEGDDYWTDPKKLQKQADFLDRHPEYALCFHRVKVFYEGGDGGEDYIFPNPDEKLRFETRDLLRWNFIQTNSVMYRRQKEYHTPDNIAPLDWYHHLYHAKFGKIGFIDEVMSAYRRHPGGIWWDAHKDVDEIWKKHGIEHLAMFEALKPLYRDSPEYTGIINTSIGNLLLTLLRVDQQYGDDLVERALVAFPASMKIFITETLEQKAQLEKDLQAQLVETDRYRGDAHHFTKVIAVRDAEIERLQRTLTNRLHRAVKKIARGPKR